MTMIVEAKSKEELRALLQQGVYIKEPTPFGTQMFPSQSCPIGFREPVCLDPQTRRRFAQIERRAEGWKVS